MKKLMATLAAAALVVFAAPAIAATNPFMDVPQGHWSYDAIGLLASRGIVSGYPDGAFKGGQSATRYEMASVVARALANIDAEEASAQDMEPLKKLVMEFKDELDALGVRVNDLDKRLAVAEDNLGGWKLSGFFFFQAKLGADGSDANNGTKYTRSGNNNSFEKTRIRLTLEKQINETTSLYAQFRAGSEASGSGTSPYGDVTQFNLRNVYVDTIIPWNNIRMRVGRWSIDWEADLDFKFDKESLFGDYRVDGFQFSKSWQNFSARAIVGRNIGNEWLSSGILRAIGGYDTDGSGTFYVNEGYWNYILNLTWYPTENFFFGLVGDWMVEDSDYGIVSGSETTDYLDKGGDISTYGAYFNYNITPSIRLFALYYIQDMDEGVLEAGKAVGALNGLNTNQGVRYINGDSATEDNPQAFKVALDLKQDLLKVTSLHFEYMEHDNTFLGHRNPYSFASICTSCANPYDNMPWNDGTTTSYFAIAHQKWNDKWGSFIRYSYTDFDTDGLDDVEEYGFGITYQFSPAILFRLAYDHIDYGSGNPDGFYNGSDHVILFHTGITF